MKGRVETKRNKALHLIKIGIVLLMVVSVMPMMVHGAGSLPKVTVFQENSSAVPVDMSFTYLLKPREAGNPMPAGSTEEGFAFSMKGKGSTPLLFSENLREGLFIYDLTQAVNEKRERVIYDQRSYRLELYIDENEEASFIVYSEEGLKVDEMKFRNDFKVNPPPERPTPPGKPLPPGRPSIPGKPITGDNTNFWLESLGIAASIGILTIVVVAKKKKAKEE